MLQLTRKRGTTPVVLLRRPTDMRRCNSHKCVGKLKSMQNYRITSQLARVREKTPTRTFGQTGRLQLTRMRGETHRSRTVSIPTRRGAAHAYARENPPRPAKAHRAHSSKSQLTRKREKTPSFSVWLRPQRRLLRPACMRGESPWLIRDVLNLRRRCSLRVSVKKP